MYWLSRQRVKGYGLQVLQFCLSHFSLTILCCALLTLCLTTLICFSYIDTSKSIDQNDISLKAFYADTDIEVVDEEAVQRKIDRAKQTIAPIYQDTAAHNQDIMLNLKQLFSDLAPLVKQPEKTEEVRLNQFQKIVGDKPDATRVFQQYFKHAVPQAEWLAVEEACEATMQQLLKTGFTEADEQLNRRSRLLQVIVGNKSVLPRHQNLVYFILNATLEPNLILDELAMQYQQEQLAERIRKKPEIRRFKKSERIIAKGQKVSAVQKAALQKVGQIFGQNTLVAFSGIATLVLLFVITLWRYLYHFNKGQFFKPSYSFLLASLTVMAILAFYLQDKALLGNIPIFALPLASIALIIAIFTHHHLAVLTVTLIVFLLSVTMHEQFQELTVLLFGSYMGIYVLSKRVNYNDRGQLMIAGFYVGLTNVLVLMVLSLVQPSFSGLLPLSSQGGNIINWGMSSLSLLSWSFASGIFSGILTIGSLPFLEAVFRLITPFTLMELGNHDHPLLKRMQFEAPGTFHHSIIVSTLSEAAAEEVGANALLTRVGCLYHDIGKMKRPLFFIENQAYFGVENPHDKLSPRLSKMVITAHPRDSIEMAKQHKLPDVLMKFMTEHHGTLTAGYFYNKACIEEGIENVNQAQFRYPGPKPGSRETAIVMLADACESAVRALKSPTVAQVEERVSKIFQQRIEDGQFDDCPITFQDIERIKQTFVRVLRGIQHNRIEYQQNMMRELGKKLPGSSMLSTDSSATPPSSKG